MPAPESETPDPSRSPNGSDAESIPVAVYDANARFDLSEAIKELWTYREVVWSFGVRRLRTRYKQAVFGLGWAVAQPLAFLALFVVFLDNAVGGTSGSYAAGSYAALVGWQFVSAAASAAGASLVNEKGIMRKVYFLREAPVIGSVGAYVPDLLVNSVILLFMAPLLGGEIGLVWVLAIVPYIVLAVAALAIGMPLAALAIYYRDFLYALPIRMQLLLFASPVAYPIDQIDARWHYLYAALNPLVGPLDSLRRIFAVAEAPNWGLLGTSAGSATLMLALGYRLLKALDRRMADVA